MSIVKCRTCGHQFEADRHPDGRCPACGNIQFIRAWPEPVFAGAGPAAAHAPGEPELTPAQQERVQFARGLFAASPRAYLAIGIIAANVLVFAFACFMGADFMQPTGEKLLTLGANHWPQTTHGQWWRLFTSAFLHFGVLHLALNMWALYNAGPITERLFGNGYFAWIYLVSALGGSLASTWWERSAVSAGASGAIFGVYGALIAYLLAQPHVFPRGVVKSMLNSTLAFVGLNVVFGLSQKGISNAAHLGGLGAGFLMGMIMSRPLELSARRRQQVPRLVVGLLIGAALLAGAVAVIPRATADDRAFLAAIDYWQQRESPLINRYNELAGQVEKQELTEEQWADAVEKELQPQWETVLSGIQSPQLRPGSHAGRLQAQIVEYIRLRCEWQRQMIRAIREGDEELAKQAEQTNKAVHDKVPPLKQVLRKPVF